MKTNMPHSITRFSVGVAAGLAVLSVAAGAGARVAGPALAVTIRTAPANPARSGEATFEFDANEPASFVCALDGGRPASCQSPVSYTGLGRGSHSFAVTATNTDAAGRRYTARASYAWTIEAPDPTPPPPPAPREAQLVVSVVGSGAVTSTPAGIACPGDCEEVVPAGAALTLSPAPASGFRFVRWGAACTGSGGCTVAVDGPTVVLAAFGVDASPPVVWAPLDGDGDGVRGREDSCPDTPSGAPPLAVGCSAVDLLHEAPAQSGRIADGTRAASVILRAIGAAPDVRRLAEGVVKVKTGALDYARGGICRGAATARAGLRDLEAVSGPTGTLATAVYQALAADATTPVERARTARLVDARRELETAVTAASSLARGLDAACSAIGRPLTLEGTVTETDDARRLVVVGGQTIALPIDLPRAPIAEGSPVKAVARLVGGGPAIATSVAPIALPGTSPKAPPCQAFVIAPFQDFSGRQKPILHDPRGYLVDGELVLEYGSRAAVSKSCGPSEDGRYSVVLSMPGEWFLDDVPIQWQLGFDLDSDDAPVPWPHYAYGYGGVHELIVEQRYQGNDCALPAEANGTPARSTRAPAGARKSYPCPIVVLSKTTYQLRLHWPGELAEATYDETSFSLEAGPQPAKVTSHTGPGFFRAEALAFPAAGSAGYETIQQGEPFTIWPDALYGLPVAHAALTPPYSYESPMNPSTMLGAIGVYHFAGLVWPRVEGTRNGGYPFRYAAELPRIVTDLLPGCPSKTCFQRLPWQAGSVGWGFFPSALPGASTVIFSATTGVLAMRGGRVNDVFGPDATGADWWMVAVQQHDGSSAQYSHLGGVDVHDGDIVERGTVLGPQALPGFKASPGGPTPCFEAFTLSAGSIAYSPCVTPKAGSVLISTNG